MALALSIILGAKLIEGGYGNIAIGLLYVPAMLLALTDEVVE